MNVRLLTLETVGQMLDIDRNTVENLIDNGRLPFVDIGTGSRKHRRISIEVVYAFSRGEYLPQPEKPEPLRLIHGRKDSIEEEIARRPSFEERFCTPKKSRGAR